MVSLYLGLVAFALYLIYDINSFTRQVKFVHSFFMIGTGLIGVATVMDLWNAWKAGAFSGIGDIALLAGAAVWFGALIYCLFFALPFEETYQEQNTEKHPTSIIDVGCFCMVGVSGFEPEASWTRTKRDTKLRHTPITKILY